MNNLALVYLSQGKYREAETLSSAVVSFNDRVLGDQHPNSLTAMANLAAVYRLQGKYAEGEKLFLKALATGRSVQGEDHPNTLLTMEKLAELYADRGTYDQANALSSNALQVRRRVLGDDHPDTLRSARLEAEILRRERQPARAEPLFAKVLESQRRVLGPGHPDTLAGLASLGRVRLEQGKFIEAEGALREAAAGYEKSAPGAWSRYRTESLLGASIAGQKNFASAEPLLVASYEGMMRLFSSIPAYERADVPRAAETLAQLYRDWNKPNKAAEWRARASTAKPVASQSGL
jgi:tetratricopeptide (TPR) repeat protein